MIKHFLIYVKLDINMKFGTEFRSSCRGLLMHKLIKVDDIQLENQMKHYNVIETTVEVRFPLSKTIEKSEVDQS